MAYRLSGTYVGHCSCLNVCPCAMDQPPTAPDKCYAALVMHVDDGNLDGTDLSGVSFALYVHIPGRFTAGNLTGGIIVDDGASDEQASALERVITGQEGGPWAEFAPLFSTMHPLERASVTFSDGETPSASVTGKTEIQFEPFRGADGSPTKVQDAMLSFGAHYMIGKGSGRSNAFGMSYQPIHGESGPFEFAA